MVFEIISQIYFRASQQLAFYSCRKHNPKCGQRKWNFNPPRSSRIFKESRGKCELALSKKSKPSP
jgi:hypothetical protein